MRFLDLFAGIGGARLGFEQAGMKCVGHVEWDRFARQSYQAIHSYGREEEYGKEFEGHDISKIKASELPRADLWVFGAPCQDFSSAGKRQGLAGDRSSLVGEVFRLIRESEERDRPEWLVYENVKGMLSSNGGRDFLQILISFDELGYDCEWQILNTKACGNAPPQNRERVYTIGHLRARGRRTIFPIGAEDKMVSDVAEYTVNTITARTGESEAVGTYIVEGEQLSQEARLSRDTVLNKESTSKETCLTEELTPMIIDDLYKARSERKYEDYSPTLRSNSHGLKVAFMNQPKYGEYKLGEVADTLTSTGKSSRQHVFIGASRGRNPENPSDRTTGSPTEQRSEVNQNGTSNTLTSVQKDNLLVVDRRIRKLTPKECWRLQGFPDYCIERAIRVGVSDSQLYKQAGNAISVNVAYVVGKAIMNEMKNDAGEY